MTATLAPPITRASQSKPHISASQLRTFSTCSLQWLLSRHYKPDFVSANLVFGSGFHSALETYYQGQLEGRTVTRDELLAAYNQIWQEEVSPVQLGAKDTPQSLEETAARMLDAFLACVTPGTVIAVEERFECQLADDMPPLVGYIDLVELRTDDDGTQHLCLVDFKTAARKPGKADGVNADQLTLYAIAAHRIGLLKQFDGAELQLEYRYVTKTKVPEVVIVEVKPDKPDANRLIEKAKVCWQAMSEELCYPNASWMCAGCGHKSLCQKWPTLPPYEK